MHLLSSYIVCEWLVVTYPRAFGLDVYVPHSYIEIIHTPNNGLWQLPLVRDSSRIIVLIIASLEQEQV